MQTSAIAAHTVTQIERGVLSKADNDALTVEAEQLQASGAE